MGTAIARQRMQLQKQEHTLKEQFKLNSSAKITAQLLALQDPNLSLPYIPVCDGAGTVEEVGENVTKFKVGDKVVSTFIPNWSDGKPDQSKTDNGTRPGLGSVRGQLSEYKSFAPAQLLKSPSNLSAIEASTLPVAGLTAWNALQYGNLQQNQIVLIHGTGGVSIFALQFAKAQGAKVIITSSSDQKLERSKQLGADFIINYKRTPEWEPMVLQLTEGLPLTRRRSRNISNRQSTLSS